MRLIDADALEIDMVIEEAETPLMPWYPSNMPMRKTSGVSIEQIDNAPTIDAVPVVRCKDCKWSIKDDWICGHPNNNAWNISTEHYCGYGERKDNG